MTGTDGGGRPGLSWTRADVACLALILSCGLWFGARGAAHGGLDWSDAPLHVMDGVFVLELLRAAPVEDPRGWAEQFYLRHPCLGILVYYPPGFAVIEAAVFSLFGVSAGAARGTVAAFAIGTCGLVYLLGRRWWGRGAGLAAALLLLTSPHGLMWLRDVMLEWPAAFWVAAAVYCYQQDRDALAAGLARSRWAWATAACIAAAFLTKQTAGFILPVILLHAMCGADRRFFFRRSAWWGAQGATAVLIAAYSVFAARYAALPARLLAAAPDFAWYPRHLSEIAGWPFLVVAIGGVGAAAYDLLALRGRARAPAYAPPVADDRPGDRRRAAGIILLWAGAWAAFSSMIAAKEPRYFFFALPPMALAAGALACRPSNASTGVWRGPALRRGLPAAALVAALAAQGVGAFRATVPRLTDYAPAVAALSDLPDADLVLVDAVRDGQFVVDAYRNPAARDTMIPLRASKLLYARAARERYGYEQFVHAESDIAALLDEFGIRYILIESALPRTHYTEADPPPRRMLRSLLANDARFRLIRRWPLRCKDPAWDDVELLLYAYPGCPLRLRDEITLSIPGMGRSVRLALPDRASSAPRR